MDRAFKGVWIPRGIWENKDLTWMEKLFLTEIESLDRERGCYAGNPYFAEFFNLKVTRTSQIINSIIQKGFITAYYERKGKQIVKRVLTINCMNLFNLLYEPIKKNVRTPLEKCRDNNTSINTINNTNINALDIDLGIEPDKAEKRNGFIKPTLFEITGYLKERNITHFKAETFFDFYASKGWMIGKNKMKDWKAAVRTWERNNINKPENKIVSTGAVKEVESWKNEKRVDTTEALSKLKELKGELNIGVEGQ